MLTKREKLLVRPWQVQRFQNHKRKVQSARHAIDDSTPTQYSHVTTKMKKLQNEKERLEKIKKENVRLLQRLGNIMQAKRLENFWIAPRPNFLNREPIESLRPKTTKGRLETSGNSKISSSFGSSQATRNSSAIRCPTCAGRSYRKQEVIPEPRIPWEPARKSWNVKLEQCKSKPHVCCSICG